MHEKQVNHLLRGIFLANEAIICLGISERAFNPQNILYQKRPIAKERYEAGKAFAASWSLHPEKIVSLVITEFVG